jgi:uncharacterized hydrophobic protein (TIGR00341 family)
MALRMIEIFVPTEKEQQLRKLVKEFKSVDVWSDRLSESRTLVRMLVPTEDTERVMDILHKRFSYRDDFRIVLLPVAACLPRPDDTGEVDLSELEAKKSEVPPESRPFRISREELYSSIVEMAKLTRIYIVLVILSAIVAAVGLMRSNVAVIVGAMVIAPLLGPNVALSFGTTLGDMKMIRRALRSLVVGVAGAIVVAVIIGVAFFEMEPGNVEIESRTGASMWDIVLALAAGSAGALSLTAAAPAALIGVMVAVALLPPLVTVGMLAGAGRWYLAQGALLVFLVNLICVNLAGVLTFLLQGIRPLTWWEADKAKKATKTAILLWSILLAALAVLILLSQRS